MPDSVLGTEGPKRRVIVPWALILPTSQESSLGKGYLAGPEGKVALLGPRQVVGKSLYPRESWEGVPTEWPDLLP